MIGKSIYQPKHKKFDYPKDTNTRFPDSNRAPRMRGNIFRSAVDTVYPHARRVEPTYNFCAPDVKRSRLPYT